MNDSTQSPLVPADVDLRDFAFMPLDVVRLRDSGLTAKATGDEFRASVLLWCASWHQIPAASLPDDDDELANICGYSRARREWSKVRAGAMRGWRVCSDGRLYHAAVAAKALEAWIEKLASAIGGATGNSKRWGVQISTDSMRAKFAAAVDCLRSLDPQSRTLRKKVVAVLTSPSPPESPPESPPDRKGQGQGQGQGQGLEEIPSDPNGSAGKPAPPTDRDMVYANGVTLLTSAGVADRNARSFLAAQCKAHGEAAVRAALDRCASERPIEPVAWLQAALKSATATQIAKPDRIAAHNAEVVRRFAARSAPQ